MGNNSKCKIITIEQEYKFRLIAISTQLSLHKILWSLNTDLKWNLSTRPETEEDYGFSIFSDSKTFEPLIVSLFMNKPPNRIPIIKQLPNIEFIIEVTGDISPIDFTSILNSIKRIENIQAAIEITPSAIKRKTPFYIE